MILIIYLYYNVRQYPINYDDVNLNIIETYKNETGMTIGYSDHTTDLKALKYAYCLGADVLEFHLLIQEIIKNLEIIKCH